LTPYRTSLPADESDITDSSNAFIVEARSR
jgi:hypothetical protein